MSSLVLQAENLKKSFGLRQVIDIPHLSVYDGDRIGLIGENGAGKTTLLRLFAGEEEADSGTVKRMAAMAFIHQQGHEINEADPEMKALFKSIRDREGLSGGEMTRNRIAAALSGQPQLLLADEPTTDLDGEGLDQLRKRLMSFRGAVILISHDRALLRLICTRIWYLEDGGVTEFPGGYDAFMAERMRQREYQQFEYDQYREEMKRLKESAQRMAERASNVKKAPKRMGNAEARLHKREWTDAVIQISHAKRTLQNRMDHLEVRERPRALPDVRMQLGLSSPLEARYALRMTCDVLKAGPVTLLEKTGMDLPALSRTALLGPNGCGKTTLLRALMGLDGGPVRFEGQARFNPAVKIGWFDQHHENTLDMSGTVLENVTALSVQTENVARTVLMRLNFKRDEVFKPLRVLSGGERAKTALARLLLMDINLLFLDEPTNHLDLFTLEELERLLGEWGGTLLFISHDEEFIRKTATRIVRFDSRRLVTFEGAFDDMKAGMKKNEDASDHALAVTTLEMRLAALAARLSSPRKGDSPEKLQAEYAALADETKALKRQGQ